jgi:Kdo2-lipid IVA lauroyltransferase/acyltransferase
VTNKPTELISLRQFAGVRYWPTWLGLFVMWGIARLPFTFQMKIGQALGLLSYVFARERRHICDINLQLCFPELSNKERNTLTRKTFMSNGIGVLEIAMAWSRNPKDFSQRVTISGMENLEQAVSKGKGVLLVCAHFSTLEICGSLFTLFSNMAVTYRPHKNPLFEAVMFNGRMKLFSGVFRRNDVRQAMRTLKEGNILWYAPDQDYGAKHSVFVPFFGVEAATITATARFAKFNDSAVLFFSNYRNEDNSGYHLDFGPILDNYPSGNQEADACKINQLVEKAVRKHPEQYLWLHKRFKTQAAGKSARPY